MGKKPGKWPGMAAGMEVCPTPVHEEIREDGRGDGGVLDVDVDKDTLDAHEAEEDAPGEIAQNCSKLFSKVAVTRKSSTVMTDWRLTSTLRRPRKVDLDSE
jgi:hypothetical protein